VNVRFLLHAPPGSADAVEYVEIHTGRDGKDTVSRRATEDDKSAFREAYAAFKAGQVAARAVAPVDPPKPEPLVKAKGWGKK
jgi:hypothetical protein